MIFYELNRYMHSRTGPKYFEKRAGDETILSEFLVMIRDNS